MTEEEREQLRTEIRTFGFVVPLVVRVLREDPLLYEIVDGEHRWEVGVEEGIDDFPVFIIDVTTDQAMMLTPILNELHGHPDSVKLGDMLKDLQTRHELTTLREVMPFSRQRFDELVGTISVDWDALEKTRSRVSGDHGEERWVERVYRMPAAVAEVVDQAVAKAKEEANASNDWQGLEFVCAEFMGR